MRPTLSLAFALALSLPVAALAQSLQLPAIDTSGLDASLAASDSFTLSVNPQYPLPGSQATLSFLSSTLDLTNASLTVSAGGKKIYQGSVQPVSVPLGKAGSAVSVTATISAGGTSYHQSVVIQPEDVSLVAEPIASAPVLYPGKPLIPLGGNTRIVAVASLRDAGGKTLDPATLSYAWTVDGGLIANSSGIGKSSIIIASPLEYRARDVSVAVQDQQGGLVGGATLTLSPAEPSVRLYEQDPLLGIRFDHALASSYVLRGTEATLYAAPYSFPLLGSQPALAWTLNGAAAETGPSITLRPAGKGQGSAALSLTAAAGQMASASASLSLIFGATASTNIFGL